MSVGLECHSKILELDWTRSQSIKFWSRGEEKSKAILSKSWFLVVPVL